MRSGGRWTRIVRPQPRTEVNEELAFHLEERVREYMAGGLDEAAARAAAQRRLGNLEPVRAECTALLAAERRTEARRYFLKVSWLDFKLGFRMLGRYPGLTIVGGLAMAFAIWLGAGTFEFISQVLRPVLPLEEGDRVVGVVQRDAVRGRYERRMLADFVRWRAQVTTVRDLGAFRNTQRNLIVGNGGGEPVSVAEMSASGFRVARVRPLMGRVFAEADEQPGAPAVAVIGYETWQRRLGGDPAVLGRTVRLGGIPVSVVGVMPKGFGFPVAENLWVPLRLAGAVPAPREGGGIGVFGRLAPGVTLGEARAELATLGRRAATDYPATHEHLRPDVLPYAQSVFPMPTLYALGIWSVNLGMVLLLALVCGNVALLMFARAATRESEIAVRTALGASRVRIITQLFAEALVLGTVAALVGLAAARFGLQWLLSVIQGSMRGVGLPFWVRDTLSPLTILYTCALTLLGAAIAGVLPALKVTGTSVGTRLRQQGAGGGGLRFGGVWTAVIVAQIALTLVFPMIAFFTRSDANALRSLDVGFPAEEYLTAQLELDREASPAGRADTTRAAFLARYRDIVHELEQRLEAEPAVHGVTLAERLPLQYHPHRRIEVEGGGAPTTFPGPGYRVSSAAVSPDFFDVLQAPVRSGRALNAGDATSPHVAVVNQSFVDGVLGGRNPVGRRIRYIFFEEEEAVEPGPWYEIVGVVRDMGMGWGVDPKVAGLYHPIPAEGVNPLRIAVHVRGDPQAFTPRLREAAAAADPALRLHEVMPLSELTAEEIRFYRSWTWLLLGVSAVALTLSLAGIYAVTSFAVARRTREIGIRMALGAQRRRVLLAVFARPLRQVGLGILVGGAMALALGGLHEGRFSLSRGLMVTVYVGVMLVICLLACLVPTRRALRVQPTEAMRAEG